MRKKTGAIVSIVVCCVALSACTSSAGLTTAPDTRSPRLFELNAATDMNALERMPGIYPYLQTLINDPASEQVQVLKVNASVVSAETKTLSVPLNDRTVAFKLRRVDSPTSGMVGWVGDVVRESGHQPRSASEIDFDPFTWISLVREGDHLAGSLYVDGQSYRVEYVGAGQHVLVKVDESRLPQ